MVEEIIILIAIWIYFSGIVLTPQRYRWFSIVLPILAYFYFIKEVILRILAE